MRGMETWSGELHQEGLKICEGTNGVVTGGTDVGCVYKSKMAPVGSQGRGPGTLVTTAELNIGASILPRLPCNPVIAPGSKPYRERRRGIQELLPFFQRKSKGLGVREKGGLGGNTALLLISFQDTFSIALGLEKPCCFLGSRRGCPCHPGI